VNPALLLEGVTKDFAVGLRGVKLRAVDGLCLRVERGQVYGLLGPNGSGKSTTLKIVLGLLAPTAGRCAIFGISSGLVAARQNVGYLPESPYFHRFLTGRELVSFYGRLSGLRGATLAERVGEVIAWVGLEGAADRRVDTYSKGMLQRIGLAQALVHRPELVILDEPTGGLDPGGTEAVTGLIRRLKVEGRTVLITSHLLAQMEEVCDRVAILDHGRLILEGSVPELTRHSGQQIVITDPLRAGELEELRGWLATRGRKIVSLGQPRARLDQVFLDAVGGRETDRQQDAA
jgi:ABC-2 type transport system ATP-binding protein